MPGLKEADDTVRIAHAYTADGILSLPQRNHLPVLAMEDLIVVSFADGIRRDPPTQARSGFKPKRARVGAGPQDVPLPV